MFKSHLPSIIWAFVILVFCGYPGSGLPHVSFHFILPLDKYVHIFLFGSLCFFLYKYFKNQEALTFFARFPLFSAFGTSSFYGILIEFLQKYVFIGRSFEGKDILADASGALLVVLYYRYKSKRVTGLGLTELVFEKKNKAYGAYFLRNHYARNSVKALLLALLIIALVFGLPFLAGLFEVRTSMEEIVEVNSMQLLDLPDFEVIEPPVAPPLKAEKVEAASKPEIVKILKTAEPLALQEQVIKNPNTLLSETVPQKIQDTLPAALDSIMAEKARASEKKKLLKMFVASLPAFPGGPEAFQAFLKKNMTYPQLAKKNGIAGTVLVSFIIDADGRAGKFTIAKSLGGGCNEEALRVLQLMPLWTPGKKGATSIPFMVSLPFEFILR
jgi:protein TonB